MIDLLKSTNNCTGCTACYSICPNKSISMTQDALGFLYPSIDNNTCIECGLCLKVCPKDKALPYSEDDKIVYYGISKSEELIMSSSSGGAFSEIVNLVSQLYGKYHCYGATFHNGEVKHIRISSTSELPQIRKSKYSQSLLADTFSYIKEDLKQNIFVLFVGTPCQVDGLNAFLKYKKYSNLLTIDLLCTGACSPLLLRNHTFYLERLRSSHIKTYDMRKKELLDGKWHIMNVDIRYSNMEQEPDKEIEKYFIGCFRQHIAFRESCYSCKYTNLKRAADITLGDYWKEDIDFSEGGYKGISVICANSEKGKRLADGLLAIMNLKRTTIQDIQAQQLALRAPVVKPYFTFDESIDTIDGSIKFMKSYYRGPLKIRILSSISHMMPKYLSSMLKIVYYRINKKQ